MSVSRTYFQIGFNRCGTTSLTEFLRGQGFRCVHWDEGNLARRLKANRDAGRHILDGYAHFEVFADMEYLSATEHIQGYKYYPLFREQIPSARFILNIRDKHNWLASRRDMSGYVQRYMRCYRLPNEEAVIQHWSEDWDVHYEHVVRDIPRDQLLVFDIESDPPEKLCSFVGLEESVARFYPVTNYSLTPTGQRLARAVPARLSNYLSPGLKRVLIRPFRKRR